MAGSPKIEDEEPDHTTTTDIPNATDSLPKGNKTKSHSRDKDSKDSPGSASAKRRCVSTACIACRRRKSKCDGNTPSCAACSSVYGTECVYDPNSDHRRKGVYKKDIDNLKTRNSTLQTLIQAILNYPENEVPELVRQIRTCESLDDVAESILARDNALGDDDGVVDAPADNGMFSGVPQFEKELSGKMGKLRLDNGSMSIIGGTSNLIFIQSGDGEDGTSSMDDSEPFEHSEDAITSWTQVTTDPNLILHLLSLYFTWHYTYFTTLSKSLFWHDFSQGNLPRAVKHKTEYCTPLLVNAMLALGCHFTSWPQARADPLNSATAGDHFFREAKRLILENDEHENPRLATVQALALMSVREAGCGREARGWVYSGMSFRMAYDLGLNIDSGSANLDDSEIDARRITIWGCFLFDKCWSNYLGRQPQITLSSIAVPKFDVFPAEDADEWTPYSDSGQGTAHRQPSRTRAIALQTSQLCEISSDLLMYFYHPHQLEKPLGKQAELKKLSELHTRLEAWRKNLPKEMDPREGQLPNVLVMHMFFQLLFIHLFRPFLKYKQATSPLPAHVSPRKFLTHAASMISKLLRIYKRTHGLRQICNIVVYISHAACTVHLLNLPDKNAARDIVHGLKHLEEIGESWLCARRTLGILQLVTRRWNIELPDEAEKTFLRAETKFGPFKDHESSPKIGSPMPPPTAFLSQAPSSTRPMVESNLDATLNPVNGLSPNALYSTTAPLASPIPTTDIPHPNGSMPMPSQKSPSFTKPNQNNYLIPQNQQNYFHNNQPAPTHQNSSPPMPFMDALVPDHDWWLKDSNQIFANWNGLEHEAMLHGNGGFDLGTGNMGYSNGIDTSFGLQQQQHENSMVGMNNGNGNGNGNGMVGMNGNGNNGNLGFPTG